MIQEAFHTICNEAQQAGRFYVSLYVSSPFYGGPEEGGWWGRDVYLEATQEFPTEAQAEAAKEAIEKLAEKLTADARQAHSVQCADELERFNWDGEAAQSALGEVDGPDDYSVVIEEKPGEMEYRGCRHYE